MRLIRSKIKEDPYPGAQKSVIDFSPIMIFLLSLSIIFLFLVFHSIIQENPIRFQRTEFLRDISKIKIVDTKTAFSILITLVGLILVRHHFILGFKPRLIYESA